MNLYQDTIVNNYYNIIRTLRPNFQEELIKLITKSLNKEVSKKKTLNHIYGAWEGEETAEELIKSIRTSRVFNREIIEF